MIELKQPGTNGLAVPNHSQSVAISGPTFERIGRVLKSTAMKNLSALLEKVNSTILPAPIIQKYMPGSFLRLMFPVNAEKIEGGTVVSVVVLYDCRKEKTLYAHPMFAGPHANPLFKNLNGPMAAPKSQEGENGNRANIRFLEHKQALWERFCRESSDGGVEQATERWRVGYYWALKMLYFCAKCGSCPWGSPFYESPMPEQKSHEEYFNIEDLKIQIPDNFKDVVGNILASDLWQVEDAYVSRGGWSLARTPWIIQPLSDEFLLIIFPSNARMIQGGAIMGLAVFYHLPSARPYYVHSLVAGPEADILLVNSSALNIPPISTKAIEQYKRWCKEAWSGFRLNELEAGLPFASLSCILEFWERMASFGGGNQIPSLAIPVHNELEKICGHLNPELESIITKSFKPAESTAVPAIPQRLPDGHVLKTLYEEHDQILEILNELDIFIESLLQDNNAGACRNLDVLMRFSNRLKETEKHHRREEEVLFPLIEERGLVCGHQSILDEHEELGLLKHEVLWLAGEGGKWNREKFRKALERVAKCLIPALRDHIFKENNILYPSALQQLSPTDWNEMKVVSDRIDFAKMGN